MIYIPIKIAEVNISFRKVGILNSENENNGVNGLNKNMKIE